MNGSKVRLNKNAFGFKLPAGLVPQLDELYSYMSDGALNQYVLQKEIWEGDKIFLRLLDEEHPFFSLKLCYEGDTLTFAALNGSALSL